MRNLVYDSGPIQVAFELHQDAIVLGLLNTATERATVIGTVNAEHIADAWNDSFAGETLRVLKVQADALAANADPEMKNAGAVLTLHIARLNSTGVDLLKNRNRSAIGDALQAQGWNQAKRNKVLDLGFVMKSLPQVHYGRDAVQADLNTLRVELARDGLRQEFDAAFNAHVSAAMDNGDRAGVAAGLAAMAAEFA